MPIFDNINGVWHKINKSFSNVNGVWVQDKKNYDNVNGVWRQTHTSEPPYTFSNSGNDYSWAGLSSDGWMYVAAETGKHFKNAGIGIHFSPSLYIETISTEENSSEWAGMHSVILYRYLRNGSGYDLYAGTVGVHGLVDDIFLSINSTTDASGYYYMRPTIYLPDGSSFIPHS